ncbi:hypothetical protein Tco_0451354 [Tanacetum coccineum]
MHDESLKYVLSDNAIVALAEKVPVTEADISTTISQADTHLGFLNSNSTTGSLSSIVKSHLVDFCFILQGELQNPDEILKLYIKKHLGPNGSCPLSLYNYGLLSKSNIEVPKRLVSKENGYKFSKKVARKASRELFLQTLSCKSPVHHNCRMFANDGRLLSHSFAEKYKKKVASDYGIPLFVDKVVNSSGGVSLLELRVAAMALLLLNVVRTYYGGREISNEDVKNALLVGRSPHEKRRMLKKRGLSLNSSSKNTVSDTTLNSDVEDGHRLHGKQVVDYLLKEHEEDGIHEFCQRWRQVFVEAINPWFLPAGWDVTHIGMREFGDFSIYNPANKGSPSAAKDLPV